MRALMRARAHLLRRALLRSEDGMAVPTVMLLVVTALALAMVSVLGSISTQRGSVRDQDSKTALAAADAGVNRALWRQNKMPPGDGFFCAGNETPSGGWCPVKTGQVGDASWSYQVSVADAGGVIKIVSAGTRDGVSRKVSLLSRKMSGAEVFGGERVMAKEDIFMDSNARIEVPVGTNGDIHLDSDAEICANARYGVGESITFGSNSGQCPGYSLTSGDRELPPLFKPGLATANDNGRFFGQDIRSSSSEVTWNSTTRTLTLNSNGTLTLGGGNYFICRLVLDSNSRLYMASGAQSRIYFDKPENCPSLPNDSGAKNQFWMSSNTEISSTGYNPALGNFDLLGFYFFGSTSIPTTIHLDSNASVQNELVIYAPESDVYMNSNSQYIGAIAGKSLHMDSNAVITSDSNMPPPLIDIAPFHIKGRYVECATTVTGAPDAGC
jgi:Tfp pilus assembly protein PilX